MATVFLVLVVVMVVAALVFGVVSLLSQDDPGLSSVEADGRARPLPNNRSLSESDLKEVRFDVSLRGYRMSQVDKVLRRTSYDLGYKDEMIAVLEAEVIALREGRLEDAELLRKARESAANPHPPADSVDAPAGPEVVLTDDIDAADVMASDSLSASDTASAFGTAAEDSVVVDAATDGPALADDPADDRSSNGKAEPAPRSAHA